MIKNINILFLLGFSAFGMVGCAQKPITAQEFQPYLENTRELQIPQWEDTNWYVEDWTVQESGMDLIKGFYKADIIRDQKVGREKLPILVVGPNFYRLSGLDKRRVMTTVDHVYGITEIKPNGSFFLEDWYTHKKIGVFDENGLRLD
ncbi:MAG: hypothetical protein R3D88_05535 [Alphaproteobacteria bacterium]|nr:hypothetical protein [Alphaproteobacteria bacterium]